MTELKSLKPNDAQTALQSNNDALLIDVRDPMEFSFVGHPLGAVNIPWREWNARQWQANPRFLEECAERVPNHTTPLYVLCRSGQRSLEASKALLAAGYQNVTNIEDGFEGSLDPDKHRGTLGGWRACGLPWQQS